MQINYFLILLFLPYGLYGMDTDSSEKTKNVINVDDTLGLDIGQNEYKDGRGALIRALLEDFETNERFDEIPGISILLLPQFAQALAQLKDTWQQEAREQALIEFVESELKGNTERNKNIQDRSDKSSKNKEGSSIKKSVSFSDD